MEIIIAFLGNSSENLCVDTAERAESPLNHSKNFVPYYCSIICHGFEAAVASVKYETTQNLKVYSRALNDLSKRPSLGGLNLGLPGFSQDTSSSSSSKYSPVAIQSPCVLPNSSVPYLALFH